MDGSPGSVRRSIIAASAVSQLGNWLTFLALVQFTQETFGSAATALTFLVQSLPALLTSRRIALLVPRDRTLLGWSLVQLVLAVLTAALVLGRSSLVVLLVYLAVATTLKTVGSTLLLTMVSDHVAASERAPTFTALGAVGSVTLTAGPAAGGALAAALGYDVLLLVDAASFVVGALVLVTGCRGAPRVATGPPPPGAGPGTDVRLLCRPAMRAWVVFPVLDAVHGLDVAGVGWVLTAYGAGGLVALVLGAAGRGGRIPVLPLAAAYVLGLGAWLLGGLAGALLGFVVAGASYGLIGGRLRHRLDDDAARSGLDSVRLWGSANQVVLAANVAVYGLGSAAFAAGAGPLPMALVVAGVASVLAVVARRA